MNSMVKHALAVTVRRWLAVLAVLAGGLAGYFSWHEARVAMAAGNQGGARRPVLVELFTSEGCSSCPPADALLAKLDATQFVAGAEAIVLSEHVTYWDDLGWHDPFSLKAMTEHQQQYAARFGLDSVYTPQVVVDGAAQLVGSDERGLARAVEKAAAVPKADLEIAEAKWVDGGLEFAVTGEARGRGRMLVAAVARDSAQTAVPRGENAGRNLRHVAVVEAMQVMEERAGRAMVLKVPGGGQADGEAGPVRLVVFVADRSSGHVLAVAERAVSR